MLKDGEKGAVIQRGRKTYAIVPHIPLGVVTPEQLKKIAELAEKYEALTLKITSAQRIAIVGLKEEHIDEIWQDLGISPGAAVGLCIRSIKACPGITFCRLAKQDSLALGAELDRLYHGRKLPWKFKMGVSGCVNQCAENCIKDLGFIGKSNGWTVTVGGNGGSKPRLAYELVSGLSYNAALELAERIIVYFEENAQKIERMGKLIERVGFEDFKNAVLS